MARNYELGQINVIPIVRFGILIAIMGVFCITRKEFPDRVLPLKEVAALAVYLCSREAGFVTGANIAINGGQHLQ